MFCFILFYIFKCALEDSGTTYKINNNKSKKRKEFGDRGGGWGKSVNGSENYLIDKFLLLAIDGLVQ